MQTYIPHELTRDMGWKIKSVDNREGHMVISYEGNQYFCILNNKIEERDIIQDLIIKSLNNNTIKERGINI